MAHSAQLLDIRDIYRQPANERPPLIEAAKGDHDDWSMVDAHAAWLAVPTGILLRGKITKDDLRRVAGMVDAAEFGQSFDADQAAQVQAKFAGCIDELTVRNLTYYPTTDKLDVFHAADI